MKMDEKEQYDALMQLANHNIEQFNKRREHSWKVTLSLWAALVGITGVGKLKLPNHLSCYWIIAIIVVGLVFIIVYANFMVNVFEADKNDKRLAFKARDLAIEMLNNEELKKQMTPFTIDEREWGEDWSATFQIFITAFLVMIAGLLLIIPKL